MTTFTSTYEKTAQAVKAGNKSELFNMIYMNANMTGGVAETIADFLSVCSTSFVADIATKYIINHRVSEKQAWCMVFETIKISHMIDAWIEQEIESINNL